MDVQLVYICGGRGTRLTVPEAGRPAGLPKALVPVGGEPLVARLVRRLGELAAGAPPTSPISPIFVHGADDPHVPAWVRAHVPGARLVPQAAPDGVASAILATLPLLVGPALVVLGDLVVEGEFVAPWPAPPAVVIWPDGPEHATRRNFGVAVGPGDEVTALVEKPKDTRGLVCGLGLYLLAPAHVAAFAGSPVDAATGERQITAALEHLRRTAGPLRALRFHGRYVNVNSAEDLAEAERGGGGA